MTDQGIQAADRVMRDLDKRLQSVYKQAYDNAIIKNRIAIKKLSDLPEEASYERRVAYTQEVKRTSNIVDNIAAELAETGKAAGEIIRGAMNDIYQLNYDYTGWSVCRDAGLQFGFTIYDKNQIAAIINSEITSFTRIAYRNLGSRPIIVQRLGNALAISTITGENQYQLMKRIQGITGQSIMQARRVAQTERTRIQSQGRDMGIKEAQSQGIEMDKQWIAKLRNTRDSHEAVHMEIVAAGERFSNGLEYPGDPAGSAEDVINCHCFIRGLIRSVSPALAAHRERFNAGYSEYMKERNEAYG